MSSSSSWTWREIVTSLPPRDLRHWENICIDGAICWDGWECSDGRGQIERAVQYFDLSEEVFKLRPRHDDASYDDAYVIGNDYCNSDGDNEYVRNVQLSN
ncbi:OLC1v1005079C1 [Oldenlandia corymbosa var. corymbosa]|uniref:OLC1v1005079C1 n=1 Tax=Oldenlandia corymbosa var. corymbosa TaxID=529605 RepID=A0AAV1DDS3_OLDCO|nr:OLC1v1005079C1 [Oldenlandia corymbosa var. corymbosa]